jgi:hypothetical protein
VPPGTQTAAAGLVAPETQLLNETSASGWVNYMRDNAIAGVGIQNGTVNGVVFNRRDLQRNWAFEMAAATSADELSKLIAVSLLYAQPSAGLNSEIVAAVNKIVIPPASAGVNAVNTAKRNRINAALLLTMASPEFLVLK